MPTAFSQKAILHSFLHNFSQKAILHSFLHNFFSKKSYLCATMIGERILNYQIESLLGEGGVGKVYLAQ
ncbi:MAG: hypothetical protein EAZ95_19140, partial [Bacteroidetes bacterium]